MKSNTYSDFGVAIRIMIATAVITGLILSAENLLEPNTWTRLLFLIAMLFSLGVLVKWLSHMHMPPSYPRLRQHARGYLWILAVFLSLFFFIFTFQRIPLFSPEGIWTEIALLAVLYLAYYTMMGYYLNRYVDKLEQTQNRSREQGEFFKCLFAEHESIIATPFLVFCCADTPKKHVGSLRATASKCALLP